MTNSENQMHTGTERSPLDPISLSDPKAALTGSDAISSSEKTWATTAHASAFIGFLIPLANILAPVLVLLIKGSSSSFVKRHAQSAVNFQITYTLFTILVFLIYFLVFVPSFNSDALMLLGLLIPGSVYFIGEIIFIVRAMVFSSKGQISKYPAFRFLSS